MLILILIDIQYSQKAVSSFEKGLNHQNHSPSDFLYSVKKFPSVKFLILPTPLGRIYLPPPLTTIWKTLHQWKEFFFNSKKPSSYGYFSFLPKIRIFPACIAFLSLRNQKFIWNFKKIISAVFQKKWFWLTDWLADNGAFIRPLFA